MDNYAYGDCHAMDDTGHSDRHRGIVQNSTYYGMGIIICAPLKIIENTKE